MKLGIHLIPRPLFHCHDRASRWCKIATIQIPAKIPVMPCRRQRLAENLQCPWSFFKHSMFFRVVMPDTCWYIIIFFMKADHITNPYNIICHFYQYRLKQVLKCACVSHGNRETHMVDVLCMCQSTWWYSSFVIFFKTIRVGFLYAWVATVSRECVYTVSKA